MTVIPQQRLAAEHEEELASYREALAALTAVCEAAAAGDLEPRVTDLGDAPEFHAARRAVNNLLDRTDAFVREASASLEYASQAQFFRRFLVHGMLGSFRAGAVTINRATSAMAETHGRLEAEHARRAELADAFENAVLGLSDSVAAAATEMEATARSLADTAGGTATRAGVVAESSVLASEAVTTAASAVEELVSTVGAIEAQAANSNQAGADAVAEAEQAQATVGGLSEASQEIGQIVSLINQVASQTRLLALNATIEAARAGEAGKGFAVVASEVKDLAAQTSAATERIEAQVSQIQAATGAAVTAIERITGSVRGMGENLAVIASSVAEQRQTTAHLSTSTTQAALAVTGVTEEVSAIGADTEETSAGAVQMTSAALDLSRLSNSLRSEVAQFLEQIR
jgi:methyl-accepting chemotaxis protein